MMLSRFPWTMYVSVTVSAFLIASGCASVKFYDMSDSKKPQDIGFEYYPAKTYLLVSKTDEGLSIAPLSIPDVTKPRSVRHQGGWGSVNFGFKTNHGMLTEFNSVTDSKGPETIGAIAGLIGTEPKLVAGLMQSGAAVVTEPEEEDETLKNMISEINVQLNASGFDSDTMKDIHVTIDEVAEPKSKIYSIGTSLQSIDQAPEHLKRIGKKLVELSNDLRDDITVSRTSAANPTLALKEIMTKLSDVRQTTRKQLPHLRVELASLEKIAAGPKEGGPHFDIAQRSQSELKSAIAKLRTFTEVAAPFGLYELRDEAGEVTFVKVPLELRP